MSVKSRSAATRTLPDATPKCGDGSTRVVAPAETVARARKLMGPMGITRVANVTGLDVIGIPVFMVCRPNARSLAVSQGKGVDDDSARASGLMESVELFHAERIIKPLRLGSFNDLRFSHHLIAVDTMPRISISAFHADKPLLWIEGVDLFGSEPTWVPYESVHMNYTVPLPTGSGCFVLSSNGLASGNHPLEAIAHGLCEVIERDATTLFRFFEVEAQEERRLDLDSVSDMTCHGLLEKYARAQVSVGVWDVTSDVGIAAFRCVVLDREPSKFRPIGPIEGMGCHPRRETALVRALTEAAQARLTLIAGSRDDTGHERFAEAHDETLMLRARDRLALRGSRGFADVPSRANATLEEDLETILTALSNAGIKSAVAVDLTRPEFNLPVFRVVVPGLETYHHVQGYAPGRRAQAFLKALGSGGRS